MKSKLYFLIALIGILFYSCENVVDEHALIPSPKRAVVNVINPIDSVNLEVVKFVAESYTKNIQTRNVVNKKIKEILPINNENGLTDIYIVNYENNQGYIILSGITEYQPILAFSERGNFNIDINDGSSLWLQEQQEFINNIALLSDSIRQKNKRAWNKFFEKKKFVQLSSQVQTKSINSDLEYQVGAYIEETLNRWSNEEGYTVYTYSSGGMDFFTEKQIEEINQKLATEADDRFLGGLSSTVYVRMKTVSSTSEKSPLLKSTWNQTNGYEVNGYPAGCVAVAMGQIMRYHRFPTLYNWDAMLYNSPTNTTVLFLSEIGKMVNMNYGPDGSGAYITDACNAFVKYGYRKANIVAHSSYRTINELSENCPVYMRGTSTISSVGHAWVCDGYKKTETYDICEVMALDKWSATGNQVPIFASMYKVEDNYSNTNYFHMNWGWGGNKDGFFYEQSVNPSGYDFSINRQNIVDIYPN